MRAVSAADARRAGAANPVHARLAALAAAYGAPSATRRVSIASLIVLTLLINIFVAATPLVVLGVFDVVIRDGVQTALAILCGIGGLCVVNELLMRRERQAIAADMGVRTSAGLAASFFSALLRGEERSGAPVSAHVSAYRTLRRVRHIATGPVACALLDAPFALATIGAMIAALGPAGLAPLWALVGYVAAGRLLETHSRVRLQHAARARARLEVALSESASKRETLEEMGMGAAWAARVEQLALDSALRREREGVAVAARDAAATGITTLGLLAALWLGTLQVLDGDLSVGACVAAIVLSWRVLTPFETVFRAWPQVRGAWSAARAARRAAPDLSADRAAARRAPVRIEGALSVRGLVVRGADSTRPALRGVSFDIAAGEVVAVCGAAGAGKSALLDAILGVAPAESGVVLVDGVDLRNLDPAAYRAQVAHASQEIALVHGAVSQNIRLAAPAADEASMTAALARAGVVLPHPQLPEGLDTRLMSGGAGQIDESLRAKIMLAGLYAKNARLYLLDDPGAFLDREGDEALLAAIAALRGTATIVLVTNRPSHMRACDRIIRLDHGMLMSDGRVEQVLG